MDFDTFKRAVDSLQDFPNMVGMIGGEPTLHPEFEKFAEYLRGSRTGGGNKIYTYARTHNGHAFVHQQKLK